MLECLLEIHQYVFALSRHTIIKQSERQAIEVAEAMLVWVMTVIPSGFTVHT